MYGSDPKGTLPAEGIGLVELPSIVEVIIVKENRNQSLSKGHDAVSGIRMSALALIYTQAALDFTNSMRFFCVVCV